MCDWSSEVFSCIMFPYYVQGLMKKKKVNCKYQAPALWRGRTNWATSQYFSGKERCREPVVNYIYTVSHVMALPKFYGELFLLSSRNYMVWKNNEVVIGLFCRCAALERPLETFLFYLRCLQVLSTVKQLTEEWLLASDDCPEALHSSSWNGAGKQQLFVVQLGKLI